MSETITVTGNVVSDPEQRQLRGDESVTSFRLASNHRRFDAETRTWVEVYTNFYSISAFRALGTNAYASLKKGQRVIVTGRLRLREWDNGTRKGLSADIDADGIGHDLLFGVTSFQPAGRPAVSAEPAPPSAAETSPAPVGAARPASVVADADGWAIPQAVGAGDTPF